MDYYDLSGKLLEWLNQQTKLNQRVGGRIFQPYSIGETDGTGFDEEESPKIMFKQMGGYPDYRYLFIVEGQRGNPQEAREIAFLLLNTLRGGALELRAGDANAIVIVMAEPEGGLTDSANEVSKAPQVFFYTRLTSI